MIRWRWALCWVALLGGCSNGSEDDVLFGKSCSGAGECASGYVCSQPENTCVRDGTASGGSGGFGDADSGAAGASAGSGGGAAGGAAGTSASGGTSGAGGATGGAAGTGGASGSGGVAGSGGAGGAAGSGSCSLGDWCVDGDGDGFGDATTLQQSCSPGTGWVQVCNDCQDGMGNVFPGNPVCDAAPYGAEPNSSYDYDCDGIETECGDFPKADPNGCTIQGPLGCVGSGYEPNPNRTAPRGANPYCGSTVWRECVSVGLPCVAQVQARAPVLCH